MWLSAAAALASAVAVLCSSRCGLVECSGRQEKEAQQSGAGNAVAVLSSFLTPGVGGAAQGTLPSSQTT